MNKKQRIIYIYFLILPIIDVLTSLVTRFDLCPITPGMLIKGLTLAFGVIYTIFITKSPYKKKSIFYFALLFIYFLFYFVTKPDIFNLSSLMQECINSFKYFYFPIMLISIINLFYDLKIDKEFIKKILFINCLTYTVLLIVPFITGTSFNSYRYDNVFGKNGWFYAANEIGVIMIILLSSISMIINSNKKWIILLAIPILFSIAIIGTKVSFLGMIIVTLLIIVLGSIKNYKHKSKRYNINIIMLLLFLIINLSFSPAYKNLRNSITLNSKNDKIEIDSNQKYKKIEDLIHNKAIVKIVKISLNGREDFFLQNYSIYYASPTVDKLFGLGWSNHNNYNIKRKLIEIDYLDLFIHYGLIGFIVYFLPLIYLLYKLIKNFKKVQIEDIFYFLLVLLVLGISSFAGHVLSAPAVSIYLVILIEIIIINLERKNNEKNSNSSI